MNEKCIFTGIGHALMDITISVEDHFLLQHELQKSSMQLISKQQLVDIQANVDHVTLSCAGSVANTMKVLAKLCKGETRFIGNIAQDQYGYSYREQLAKHNVDFITRETNEEITGCSVICVTPDAIRTMCTYLGASSLFTEEDIREEYIKDTRFIYIEGYLWDREATINALLKLIHLAKKHKIKIAFSLSDPLCVERHKDDFRRIVTNDVDILFANHNEFCHLMDLNPDTKITPAMQVVPITCVTMGAKGAVILFAHNEYRYIIKDKLFTIDTTGAGDFFAAGILYGLYKGFNMDRSNHIANKMAEFVIKQFGTGLENFDTRVYI